MLKHKNLTLTGVKTSGLADGQFEGFASVFDHLDYQGDVVKRGAFAKSLASGRVTPLIWEHQANDPRAFVGEVKSAEETDEGLKIVGQFDMDTEAGAAAYRQVKARRVTAMSIGYSVTADGQRKTADGVNELLDLDLREISLVSRPANDRAVIGAVKSERPELLIKARAELAKASGDPAADDTEDPADDDTAEQTVGERLLGRLQEAMDAAQELIDAAEDEGRDLTEDEGQEVAKALRRVRVTKREIQTYADATPDQRRGLQHQGDVVTKAMSSEEFEARYPDTSKFEKFDATSVGIQTKTSKTDKAKEATVTNTKDKFIGLGAHGRKAAAAELTTKMIGTGASYHDRVHGLGDTGTKAVTSSGQVITNVPMVEGPVPLGRPATSILDVVPTIQRTAPTYNYLRQTARDLKAAAVAPGATKPTSTLTTTTVNNSVSVIAHLSEAVDKFALEDSASVARLVQDEMLYGLDLGIQDQVLNGDGTGANQTGVLETSGVQVQAFATDLLTTIRKAITSAETLGYAPSVLVISPADWEALELLAATDAAVGYRGVPLDQGARKIWGLTAVLSNVLPAKTAVVMDPSAVSIDTAGPVSLDWSSESGDLFAKNQLVLRAETRIGVSVYRPEAITKVTTAAA